METVEKLEAVAEVEDEHACCLDVAIYDPPPTRDGEANAGLACCGITACSMLDHIWK
jgi:hypothetical protein